MKGEDTRARILHEGLALVSRRGFEGTTIGALAEQIGMSKSGLYAHFRSKEELQLALLRAAITAAEAALREPLAQVPPGLRRLRTYFAAFLDWPDRAGLPGGCPFVTAAVEFDDGADGAVRELVVTATNELVALFAGLVRDAVSTGELLPRTDSDTTAWRLMGVYIVHHTQARLLRRADAATVAMASFDAVLEPFLTPRRRAATSAARARKSRR
jgi:AcrR family transcriptional regulator